jgi:hypothetical protein
MHGNTKSKYRNTVRDALRIADLVVFTGPLSNTVRKGLPPEDLARLHIFKTVYEANEFLKDKVAEGDLVLLKGSAGPDHLERVYLDQIEQISCWREHCGRKGPCITCWRQQRPYLPKQSSR